jgi:exodeoxyribonuclease VII small subunit
MTLPDDLAALSFEAALARLEKIVHTLEAGDASLEDSIALYTEGQALKAHCETKLAGATARIEAIQIGADGAAKTTTFDA